MFGCRRDAGPAVDAAGTSAGSPAARLTRRERRDQRARAALEADFAARVARANRRLAQVSGDGPDPATAAPPSSAVPPTPPMAHPTPSPEELDHR